MSVHKARADVSSVMEPTMEPPALEHKKMVDRTTPRASPRTTFYIPLFAGFWTAVKGRPKSTSSSGLLRSAELNVQMESDDAAASHQSELVTGDQPASSGAALPTCNTCAGAGRVQEENENWIFTGKVTLPCSRPRQLPYARLLRVGH